jgi:hypothetical protein
MRESWALKLAEDLRVVDADSHMTERQIPRNVKGENAAQPYRLSPAGA